MIRANPSASSSRDAGHNKTGGPRCGLPLAMRETTSLSLCELFGRAFCALFDISVPLHVRHMRFRRFAPSLRHWPGGFELSAFASVLETGGASGCSPSFGTFNYSSRKSHPLLSNSLTAPLQWFTSNDTQFCGFNFDIRLTPTWIPFATPARLRPRPRTVF
jgi:hypothetical protein